MTKATSTIGPPRHFWRDGPRDRHQARRAATVLSLSAGLTGRALDYGAGWGDLTARLAPQFNAIEGVDVEADRVAFAAEQYAPITFRQCATEGLPYADAAFDVVFSTVVLHFVPSAAGYLAECRRVLRPDGHLVIMIQNPESMWMLARRWRTGTATRQSWGGSTIAEFRAWLAAQRFEVGAEAGFYDPPIDRIRTAGDVVLAAMNAVGQRLSIAGHWSYVGFRCRSAA